MKKITFIIAFLASVLFVNDLMADAWGQHYAKCYIGTKRYRAHAQVQNYYNSLAVYNPVTGNNDLVPNWSLESAGFQKHCTRAKANALYSGYRYLSGSGGGYTYRYGYAYSEHAYNYAQNITQVNGPYTQAGYHNFVPSESSNGYNRTGFSNTTFNATPLVENNAASISNFSGTLEVANQTLYTAEIKVWIVKAKFDPKDEYLDDSELENGFDLSNYEILGYGSIKVNGYGVQKDGIFAGSTLSQTISNDGSITKRVLNLNQLSNFSYTYNIPSNIDEELVSIITFSDSYYDFATESGNTSNKKSSFEENTSNTSFSLYPTINPDGEQYINITPTTTEVANVELIDINGKVVKTLWSKELLATEKHRLYIDKSTLSSGVYFVRYHSNTVTKVEKILITK